MILNRLLERQLIHPPKWLISNTHYITIMGSKVYGCATNESDTDLYGFAIPEKTEVFPHLKGELVGFGRQIQRFEQYQQHGIEDKEAHKNYDITIYNIVKYFSLLMENNPNILDSLFVHNRHIIHCTRIATIVRENRKTFLHKGAWFKFKGYSYSQQAKMKLKTPAQGSKRDADIEKWGYDLKFAVHLVRLLNEVEQILIEHDLDLERNSEQLKSIRRGEWKEEEVYKYFENKEKQLEKLYTESKLQHSPNEEKIKGLLLNCLEEHYGNLDKCIVNVDAAMNVLRQVKDILEKNDSLFK